MKKILIPFVAGALFVQGLQAQLLVEHFSYSSEGRLGLSGIGDAVWTAGDSPSVALVVTNTAALTNAALAGIEGKGLLYSGSTFKKKAAPFPAQSSGTVYCSFLLSIQTPPGGTVKAFIYLHNSSSATSSPELGIFLNGNDIGLGKGVNAPAISTTLSAGTHFIVASYTFQSDADRVNLWVDPSSLGDNNNVPGATLTTTNGSDGSTLSYVFLTHAVAQTLWFDELRVGTSWADVTPTSGAPPSPPANPVITNAAMTVDGFVLSGTNGLANADYDVLTSTNLTLPLSQWVAIGTDSFGTNGHFTFASSIAPDVRQKFYRIRVGNTNAPPPVAPIITVQPHDTTNLLGNVATFTVGASGTAPLSFRWYFNSSTLVSNGTSSTLTLNNIQYSDAGGYSVIVSNIAGSVTSAVAQLIVTNLETPPFITTQPQSQTVAQGQTVNFSVVAGGSVPFYYQWYFNDTTPLADRTNALLTLTNVATGDAGGYSVTISNAFGITNSVTATLIVNTSVPPDFSAIGFCNDGRTITGGAAGPTVYVGSQSELQSYSQVNPPYVIYITNSFNLSGMETHIYPNKTVIGVGNVVLSGGGLYLYRSTNVIIRNLTISGSTEDDIGIHYSDHIWIDHCTLVDATDGSIDITQASDYITISWCKFIYNTDSGHDFVNLIASSDADNGSQFHTTFHHNWWSTHCVERMPSVRFGRAHMFNNYYNAPGNNYCVRTRIEAECRVENNFFENVKNPWEQYITGASDIQGKLFAANNNVPFLGTAYGVTWSGTTTNKDGSIRVMVPGTDTVFTPSYSYTLDPASQVSNLVTNYAAVGKGPFAP
jgi:pectate lyase